MYVHHDAMCAYMFMFVGGCKHVFVCVCIRACVHMYVCVCV